MAGSVAAVATPRRAFPTPTPPPSASTPLRHVRAAPSFSGISVVLTRTSEVLKPPHVFAGLLYRGYRAIAIDAPTHFKCRTALQVANWNSRRDVERHYRTMTSSSSRRCRCGISHTPTDVICFPGPVARICHERTS